MTIKEDLEKHMIFDKAVRLYITDCLECGPTEIQIMESFEVYIKVVRGYISPESLN